MENGFFNAKQLVLKNGINVVTIKKDTQIMSVHTGIKIGSLYEKKNERGISHFIEHMLFKGTKSRSNEKLNDELENMGGEYNAYTEYSSTVYGITALSCEMEKSIEILSDMLQNSTFPQDEIEKEKKVIIAEIKTSKDDIEDYSFQRINEEAFKDSPLKISTVGTEAVVRNFTREDIFKFYKKYYVPNNCYITVVSPFEHQEVIGIINKYFNSWKWQEFNRENVIVEDNIPGIKTSYKNDIELGTISYIYTFHNLTRFQELALKILNHRFGLGGNSILFRKLREENGYAYDVYSDLDTSKYVKIFYIYTAVNKEHIDESLNIINECIKSIKERKINFDESTIVLMKKVLKTAVAATLEDSTDIGNYTLHQKMDGKDIFAFTKDIDELEKIKKEDIYNAAKMVFNDPTIHILLPKKGE